MDQPDIDPQLHAQALVGLARVNRWSRTSNSLLKPITRLARDRGAGMLSVLDVACGGADVSIRLVRLAFRHRLRLMLTGYDLSPTAVERAQEAAEAAKVPARFKVCDVLTEPFAMRFDIVMSSLFLHHLDDSQVVELLKKMAAAARELVVVSDLDRRPLGYLAAKVACRVLTRSPVVRVDGPRSVAAAFRPDELLRLSQDAGLSTARIQSAWPFRQLLSWEPAR